MAVEKRVTWWSGGAGGGVFEGSGGETDVELLKGTNESATSLNYLKGN